MGITAVRSETLSSRYDERYIVDDDTTGEIIDDARGSGYRSEQKALKAYGYKHSLTGSMEIAASKRLRKAKREERMRKQHDEKIKKRETSRKQKAMEENDGKEE